MKIMLFARARDIVGRDSVTIELPTGATVADLRSSLAMHYPPLAGLIAHSAIAVNSDYAADDRMLRGDEEIALLPPVSGG
jgi:molybdopterin converting factor subunit 1